MSFEGLVGAQVTVAMAPWSFLLAWMLLSLAKKSCLQVQTENPGSEPYRSLGGARDAFHLASLDLLQAIDAASVRANPSPEQAQLLQVERGPHRSLEGKAPPSIV